MLRVNIGFKITSKLILPLGQETNQSQLRNLAVPCSEELSGDDVIPYAVVRIKQFHHSFVGSTTFFLRLFAPSIATSHSLGLMLVKNDIPSLVGLLLSVI